MDEVALLNLLDQFQLLGDAWHGHPNRRAEAAAKAPKFPRGKQSGVLREWARVLAVEAHRRGVAVKPFSDVAASAWRFSDIDVRPAIEHLRAILSSESSSPPAGNRKDAWLDAKGFAEEYNLGVDAARKRLTRARENESLDSYKEVANPKRGESQYIYHVETYRRYFEKEPASAAASV